MVVGEIAEGVVGNALWHGVVQGWRLWSAGKITITSPRPLESLHEAERTDRSVYYSVRGRLGRLPKGHRIWLLTELENSRKYWPQGYASVKHNPDDGTWHGLINPGASSHNLRVHAVVAPPTTDDFFLYYRKVSLMANHWEPLERIPPECVNRTSVQPHLVPILSK